MDLTVRKLRYFAVVAEERHFTRAAARLFVAQQSLSRQIRDLEGEVGALLFYRTTRSVELTPAGEAFLAGVQSALASLDAGINAARRHDAGGVGHLRIGFGLGAALELTPYIVEEFSRQFPNVEIEMREFGLPDQSAGLSDHWADVSIIRPPLADPRIEAHTLFVEPRVLTVSVRHALAQRETVSVADILDIPLAVGRSTDEEYRRFWSLQDFQHRRHRAAADADDEQYRGDRVDRGGSSLHGQPRRDHALHPAFWGAIPPDRRRARFGPGHRVATGPGVAARGCIQPRRSGSPGSRDGDRGGNRESLQRSGVHASRGTGSANFATPASPRLRRPRNTNTCHSTARTVAPATTFTAPWKSDGNRQDEQCRHDPDQSHDHQRRHPTGPG